MARSNGVGYLENIPASYDADKICFMGNMRSMQNQDAALYFANEVFPLIKKERPTAKFHIVGSLPPPSIQALASEDIIVTGFVDDLEAYIGDSCLKILRDPALRRDMGRKGYDMVLRHYSWSEKLNGYERL